MKGKEFVNSKWVQQGATPAGQKRVKDNYGKCFSRANISILLKKTKQLYQFFISSDITALQKALVAVALIYIIFPLDLIPDYIPIVGWLDDLGIAGFALNYIFSQMNRVDELTEKKLMEGKNDGTGEETKRITLDVQDGTTDHFDINISHRSKELDKKINELAERANVMEIYGVERKRLYSDFKLLNRMTVNNKEE